MQYIVISNFYNNNFNNFNVSFLTEKNGDTYKNFSFKKENFKNKNGNLNGKKLKKYIKDYFKDELIKFNYISIKAIN